MNLLLVVVGGGVGSGLRFLVGTWMQQHAGTEFPWGTMIVNVSGAFLIGLVLALVADDALPGEGRMLVGVGLVGGYTTFSTLSHDTIQLVLQGEIPAALLNSFGQMSLGLLATYLGMVFIGSLQAALGNG